MRVATDFRFSKAVAAIKISGAIGVSYTVPPMLAYGDNVQFYRLAKTVDCTGETEKKSNIVTVTFTGYIMPEGCTLVVGGVCWASANIDNLQQFATRPDMHTKFYQWNRLTAYSADDPLSPAWNATAEPSETWTVNPCPMNWRLPSQEEYTQLHNSGSTWVNAGTRGATVNGRFYGYNHISCALLSNMNGCVFFPAAGYRNATGAIIGRSTNGYYWSNNAPPTNFAVGFLLVFPNGASNPSSVGEKGYGYPIRCVQ